MEPHDPSALELSLPDSVFANFGYGKTFILGSRFNANTSRFGGGGWCREELEASDGW